ncbi:MAG TPA: ankyrin repeat domain-containing protein [Bacteroidales bacterium]|nr:ankyrin repeat domain-containing protein [Bacteroidales bacterium]HRT46923.1 ankyrin repeat domain-containing protein [Bacteroidales bacterium]HRU56563.1 ankyrin repeat domain-containing protein [Bacteroidales bacterium]
MPLKLYLYLRIVAVLLIIASHTNISSSQENKRLEEEDDTLRYISLLRGPEAELNLNYALLTAAAEGKINSIRWLIKYGADVNTSTMEGVTPLHFAVGNDKTEAVKVLLEYGPKLDVLSNYSESPLHIAVKKNNTEIAEILARAGADVNIRDRFGATPLHYACAYGYFSAADMLLYYDAAIYTKDNEGTTPLMAAVWAGHANIADLLLQNGADPSDRDNDGFTPFLIAAQNGDTLIMDLLIKRFVNIYETNNYNYNALDLCIMSNHKEALEYLLRKGDKWSSSEQSKAVSPYAVAIAYGRTELINLLTKYNIPQTIHKGFDQVNIVSSTKFNLHDIYTGISASFKEPLRNFGVLSGIDFKPAYTRVIIKKEGDVYYQYMDKSYLFYAGLFKDFRLTDYPLRGNWTLTASLSGGYFFANRLKGTNETPGGKIKILPAAGLKWTKNNLLLKAELEYFRTPFYKIGPLWITAGIGYTIYFNKIRAPGKYIRWY